MHHPDLRRKPARHKWNGRRGLDYSQDGALGRWIDGLVERWIAGVVEWWSGGVVERGREGVMW